MKTKAKTTGTYRIESDSIRSKLTTLLVNNEVAQAMIEAWLDGKGLEIPEGMTVKLECQFELSIVPIPENGQAN